MPGPYDRLSQFFGGSESGQAPDKPKTPRLMGGPWEIAESLPDLASKLGIEPESIGGRAASLPARAMTRGMQVPGEAWRAFAKAPSTFEQPEPEGLGPSQLAQDINLPSPPKPPTQMVGGTEYPAGRGPSAVLGGAPVPYGMWETSPEERTQLQAKRQRMGTDQALEGLRARQDQPAPFISEWEMTQRAATPEQTPTRGAGGQPIPSTATAPGAQQYWQRQLGERTGDQTFKKNLEKQQYSALQGALTAQQPVVAGAAEQAARRASMPAVANAQTQLAVAKTNAQSREEIAEIEADEAFLGNLTDRLDSIETSIARIAASPQGRTDEGQLQIQEFQRQKDAYEQAIAAMSGDE